MTTAAGHRTCLVVGETIARYGFGNGHPFGPDRHEAFLRELTAMGLRAQVDELAPRAASVEELTWFHAPAYVELVRQRCETGQGFLDGGDTPAMRGLYEAASHVVGAALVATDAILAGHARRGFVPIAGLHHAARSHAAGFCVFNDAGVVAEYLKRAHGFERIAYVDIDAHHGDGVYFGFESDPALIFADIHEDGRYLYPGTGTTTETGLGAARGTKRNLPLLPGAGDADFFAAWAEVEAHLDAHRPQFILFQCGADSLDGDPITHLKFTEEAHAHAARRLCVIAERHAGGRLLGLGGGGYNRRNLARAWSRVVGEFVAAD